MELVRVDGTASVTQTVCRIGAMPKFLLATPALSVQHLRTYDPWNLGLSRACSFVLGVQGLRSDDEPPAGHHALSPKSYFGLILHLPALTPNHRLTPRSASASTPLPHSPYSSIDLAGCSALAAVSQYRQMQAAGAASSLYRRSATYRAHVHFV